MLRRLLILFLVNSVIWLVSIIVLLGLFIFMPQKSPWFHSTLVAWLVGIGIAAIIVWGVLIRNWLKSRRSA